jgi:MoaA/NifB/PqqE/SkfB family radical SAM enzyme
MKLCRQGAPHTGHACNQKCEFCFQKYCDDCTYSTDNIKEQVDFMISHGDNNILLGGGECTISPSLFPVLDYISTKPAIAGLCSNGLRLADKDFCGKVVDHGVSMIQMGIHSADPDLHDHLTGVKDSWGKAMQGVRNMLDLGVGTRAYICLTNKNYDTIYDTITFLATEGVKFATISQFDPNVWPWTTDKEVYKEALRMSPPQELVAPHMTEVFSWCETVGFPIVLRMANFCRYRGYERYLRNWMQAPWSQSDCNYNTAIWTPYRGMMATDFDRRYIMHNYVNKQFFTLPQECLECSMNYICGGVQKAVASVDSKGLMPYGGEKVEDPLHFAGDTSWEEDWFKDKLGDLSMTP